MLEGIVSKLLMRYLKEYIETINPSQMEMALWKGHAKFKNLSIRSTVLLNQMIPFRILRGMINSIDLEFPWKSLDTQPCIIHIKDVFIVLSPEKEILIKKDLQPKQSTIKSADNQEDSEDEEDTWQSVIDSIFDNAKLDIERIHVRLEIPGEFNTLAFGLIIPSITLRTVDPDKNEIKAQPGELVTRKRLLIQDISVYFDTLSDPIELQDFTYIMKDEMRKNHQFLIEPFSIDIVLVHSREKYNPLKNQIDILIKKLSITLDYLQSRAIMKFVKDWNKFQRRRCFTHCMRPAKFENTAQYWEYSYRCAITLMRPYDFNPSLALLILKNRKLYLKQMRKTQNVSTFAMYQNFNEKKLQKIEETIGQEATLFLHEYCAAVLTKEQRNYENNLTPIDFSDIREIHSTHGDFFTKDSFSVCFGLPNFEISLNYSKGTPLLGIALKNISAGLSYVEKTKSYFFKLLSFGITSYVNENPYIIFQVKGSLPHFVSGEARSNGEKELTTDLIIVDSFIFRIDYKTMNTAVDFFVEDRTEQKQQYIQSKDSKSIRIYRIDAFDAFKSLLHLRNHIISVRNHSFSIIYPFSHEDKIDELKITISNIDFSKVKNVYYPQYAPITKLDMGLNFTIDKLSFSNTVFISEFVFDSQFTMAFTKFDLDLDVNVSITPITISLVSFPFDALQSFLSSLKLITFLAATDFVESKKVVSFRKVKTKLNAQISSLSLDIKEGEIDTSLKVNYVKVKADFYRGISSSQIIFKSISLADSGHLLIDLSKEFSINLTQEIETKPIMLALNLIDPYINGDMIWIKHLMDVIKLYLNVFGVEINLNASQDSGAETTRPHLNILITNPMINISHDKDAPYIKFSTAHIYDDENFKIFIDVTDLEIIRQEIQVLEPLKVSLWVKTEEEIVVFMYLPLVFLTGAQPEYTYILPFISHMLEVLPIDNNQSQKTMVDMTIAGLELSVCNNDLNDEKFINCTVGKTKIDVITYNNNIDVKVVTNHVKIDQLFDNNSNDNNNNNNNNSKFSSKPMLDIGNLKFVYESNSEIDKVYVDVPTGLCGLSDQFLNFVPFFANFDYPPYPLPRRDTLVKVYANVQPLSISLFNKNKTFFEVELGVSHYEILADPNHPEKTELTMNFSSIFGTTSFFDEKVIEIERPVQIDIKKQVFKGCFDTINFTFCNSMILELINFFKPLTTCQNDSEIEGIPFDFDVSFNEIYFTAVTTMKNGPHCTGTIKRPKFILNASEKLAALAVESIYMFSGYTKANQTQFLDISGVSGVLAFSEQIDISHCKTFEDVSKIPHMEFIPYEFVCILIDAHITDISLKYTHKMALAIIGCFTPKSNPENITEADLPTQNLKEIKYEPKNDDNCPKSKNALKNKTNDKSPPKVKMTVRADSFSLILSIITPIAFFKIQQFNINLDEEWNVSVKSALIEPSEDHIKLNIPLFRCPPDKDLIRFQMKNDEMVITFLQSDLFFDYTFWIPIISFITQSPFLHITSIIAEKENATKDSIEIPFKLNLKADKFHIILPITLNYDTCQMLHIEMGYNAGFLDNILNASINDMTIHVSDQIKRIDFAPIIKNLSIVLENMNFDQGKIQLYAKISPIRIILSAFDFVLLGKIAKSFKESIGLLVVSADTFSSEPSTNSIEADVHLDIGKMKVLIVKDNRSSTRFTPIFKVKNTPINLKMNSKENLTITLGVSPYISYFNESSGRWDLIIEPLSMNIDFSLSHKILDISAKLVETANINLPTSAIAQYLNLWHEIKNNISQEDIVFETLPQVWFQNNLGSIVRVTYSEKSKSKTEISIKQQETVEIYEFKPDSKIVVDCEGKQSTIRTRYLNYPTIYSRSFSVVRKPHKGGTLIQFNPPVQLINNLSIDFELYAKNGEEYTKITTIKSGQQYPLTFTDGKTREFTFTDPQFKDTSHNLIARISPFDSENFKITVFKEKKIRCVVYIEFETAVSKVFKVSPYVVGVNLLPFPLYIKHKDEKITEIEPNKTVEMIFIDSSTNQFEAALSLQKDQFSDFTLLKIKKSSVQVPVYPEEMIALRAEILDDQLRIFFFVPCVLFNQCTNKEVFIKESSGKNPIERSIKEGKVLLWCPPSYINDNDQLSVFARTATSQPNQINCLEFQNGTLYLQSNVEIDLFDGIRYRIVIRNNISVATFSPLLIIKNELPKKITLQPLECIPRNFVDDIMAIGCPTSIEANSKKYMELMSTSGSFLVWIEGFWNSPSISLLEQRKIVFKMHTDNAYEVVEVEISDIHTSFYAVFRYSSFPTPIVIANTLENDVIKLYQKVDKSPFVVGPLSTSIFAFDEPMAYPNAHLLINGMNFNISLIEDTEQILLKQTADSSPIYVKIKQNISGIRTVFISSEKEENPHGFQLNTSWFIPNIFISIIDLQMREFCLLSLTDLKGRLDFMPNGTAFQFEITELQIDDQNPLAPNPVILLGRHSNDSPFVKVDSILTSDAKPMTSFKYISLLIQRIDIQIDSSFLSDAINISMKLAKPITLPIRPVEKKLKFTSTDPIVTYNWLEVSPIYFMFNYKNLTGRPTTIAPMFYPMRFIPSIATTKMLFPGIIIAHLTDRLDFIIEKVSGDYKTAALEQVLESLGTSGKMLTTFGVTATIAEKLDITMKSALTDSIENFKSNTTEEFDNRRDIDGCFSQQTLSALQKQIKESNLTTSNLIEGVASEQKDNGLMLRDFPGSGFGHGIVGVLKKTSIDIMEDVKVMSGVERKRVPRAFPDNKIEKFDEEICKVQNTIQTIGKNFEKIQMKTKNDENGDYICITEAAIYFIAKPFDKIKMKIRIKEIRSIKVDVNRITVEYGIIKKQEVISCTDENEADCLIRYLESQRIYSDLFTKSIV